MKSPDCSGEEISDSISLRSSGSFAQASSRNSRRRPGGKSIADVENLVDLLQVVPVHRQTHRACSSRYSQALARRQSRSTVVSEIRSTSAASLLFIPPK